MKKTLPSITHPAFFRYWIESTVAAKPQLHAGRSGGMRSATRGLAAWRGRASASMAIPLRGTAAGGRPAPPLQGGEPELQGLTCPRGANVPSRKAPDLAWRNRESECSGAASGTSWCHAGASSNRRFSLWKPPHHSHLCRAELPPLQPAVPFPARLGFSFPQERVQRVYRNTPKLGQSPSRFLSCWKAVKGHWKL